MLDHVRLNVHASKSAILSTIVTLYIADIPSINCRLPLENQLDMSRSIAVSTAHQRSVITPSFFVRAVALNNVIFDSSLE